LQSFVLLHSFKL